MFESFTLYNSRILLNTESIKYLYLDFNDIKLQIMSFLNFLD